MLTLHQTTTIEPEVIVPGHRQEKSGTEHLEENMELFDADESTSELSSLPDSPYSPGRSGSEHFKEAKHPFEWPSDTSSSPSPSESSEEQFTWNRSWKMQTLHEPGSWLCGHCERYLIRDDDKLAVQQFELSLVYPFVRKIGCPIRQRICQQCRQHSFCHLFEHSRELKGVLAEEA